jgi:hypothetical protein
MSVTDEDFVFLQQQFVDFVDFYGEQLKIILTEIERQDRTLANLLSGVATITRALAETNPNFRDAFNRLAPSQPQPDEANPIKERVRKLQAEMDAFRAKAKDKIH